jgi:multicomponent Na+:H+ antiporter subunit G
MTPSELLSAGALAAGATLVLLAGIGLHRFESVLARTHPATKAITLAVWLVALGAALRMELPSDVARLLLVAAVQLVSAPIAAHMIARAAYQAGTGLNPRTQVDELAGQPLDLLDRRGALAPTEPDELGTDDA